MLKILKEDNSGQLKYILFVFAGYSLIYATLEILSAVTGDPLNTVNAFIIMAGVIIATVISETILFKYKISQVKIFLGTGKPTFSSIVYSIIISLLLFLCYPLITMITGYSFRFPDNWLWIAAGIFFLHGIAEEILYRAFLFRHLRTGRSFFKAVLFSIIFFAAAHIPIIIYQGIMVGGTALLLAAVSSFPLSKLYEKGNHTIWAPAIVHFSIDTVIPFMASDFGGQSSQTAVILWMIASMIIPYIVFLDKRTKSEK